MIRQTGHEIAQLPLILRCIVIAGSCTGLLGATLAVTNVITTYPADDVVSASIFGFFEGSVLLGAAGCVLGLLVGVFAYLTRMAVRGARRHP